MPRPAPSRPYAAGPPSRPGRPTAAAAAHLARAAQRGRGHPGPVEARGEAGGRDDVVGLQDRRPVGTGHLQPEPLVPRHRRRGDPPPQADVPDLREPLPEPPGAGGAEGRVEDPPAGTGRQAPEDTRGVGVQLVLPAAAESRVRGAQRGPQAAVEGRGQGVPVQPVRAGDDPDGGGAPFGEERGRRQGGLARPDDGVVPAGEAVERAVVAGMADVPPGQLPQRPGDLNEGQDADRERHRPGADRVRRPR